MNKISTVIITYNEEENIKNCLKSVKWTDEIIVVDSYSTDKTIKICKEYGKKIKIFQRRWTGYSSQKNFGISRTKHKWVLSIDADEYITPELKDEIIQVINENKTYSGYKISRKNFYFGKWIRWGGNYPDYQLRLFQKKYGKFKIVPLHEGVSVKGQVGKLKNPMLHFSYRNIDDYFKRFINYTELEKNIMISKNIKINLFSIVYYLLLLPLKKFISRYIFKLGFLDGIDGLIVLKLNNITKIVSFYKYYLWHRNNGKV